MEREMCQFLEWELHVDSVTLRDLEEIICKDFVDPGPYLEWELNVDPITLLEFKEMICKDFVDPGPYLEWELSVDPVTLREFVKRIRKDFADPGPYPTVTYILPSTKKTTPPPTAIPFTVPSSTSPSLSYGQRYPSPPKLIFPAPQNPTAAYMTPPLPQTRPRPRLRTQPRHS